MYLKQMGASDNGATPGNLGSQLVLRNLANDETETLTLSLWASLHAIMAFAGENAEQARYYSLDDLFFDLEVGKSATLCGVAK
jgi:heme-degrading monooxygenase HmoA